MADLKLGVNVDHVATIRQARYRSNNNAEPDLLFFVNEAIRGGADSITAHLREDRRHIQDEDILLLRKNLKVPLKQFLMMTLGTYLNFLFNKVKTQLSSLV